MTKNKKKLLKFPELSPIPFLIFQNITKICFFFLFFFPLLKFFPFLPFPLIILFNSIYFFYSTFKIFVFLWRGGYFWPLLPPKSDRPSGPKPQQKSFPLVDFPEKKFKIGFEGKRGRLK